MTYLEYLFIFIILPIFFQLGLLFSLKVRRENALSLLTTIGTITFLSIIALVYTTPWDNYLVAHRIWYYDPQKILGIIFGYVPIEEYSFFILETVLVSLFIVIVINLRIITFPESYSITFSKNKLTLLIGLLLIWLFSLLGFVTGNGPLRYMNLLLIWALPPIMIQITIGWEIIEYNKKAILTLIVLLSSYLALTDFLAIYDGIWKINSNYTIGIVFIVLPLEEILFFFVTVILTTFGFILTYYFIEKTLNPKINLFRKREIKKDSKKKKEILQIGIN